MLQRVYPEVLQPMLEQGNGVRKEQQRTIMDRPRSPSPIWVELEELEMKE